MSLTWPDSARRRLMYRAGFERDAERAAFPGPDEEFLRSLGMRLRKRSCGGASVASS